MPAPPAWTLSDDGRASLPPPEPWKQPGLPPASALNAALNTGRFTILPQLVPPAAGAPLRLRNVYQTRYTIRQRLGEGGMGAVDLAFDRDIGRPVALKKLHPRMLTPGGIARFISEVRTVGRLEHPNIVPVHDVGLDEEGNYYFVMKYVEGETVAGLMERLLSGDPAAHREWPAERRVEVIVEILRALDYAHGQGVLHRDIKPENILLGRHGEVFVTDWGIAKHIGQADPEALEVEAHALQTRVGTVMGTPLYMSPEQIRGENDRLDGRSDIYSLGLLLYEFLTLRHPWRGQTDLRRIQAIQARGYPFARLSLARHPAQTLPPIELLYLCERLCSHDRDLRPSAREAMEQLVSLQSGRIPIQCHRTLTKRLAREAAHFSDRYPNISFGLLIGVAASSVAGIASMLLLSAG